MDPRKIIRNNRELAWTVVGLNAIVTVLLLSLGWLAFSHGFLHAPLSTAPVSTQAASGGTVVGVVAKANPAVVAITISEQVPVYTQQYRHFGPFTIPTPQQQGTQEQEVGGGSGFFVSSDGLIVTNKHVVADEKASYTVLTTDGKEYDAEVVARDPVFDIAVLRVKGSNFPHLQFADSDGVQLGESVIAIGNALAQFQNSVSVGVVSGLSRSVEAGDFGGEPELLDQVIQTDAAINPGNSGGPLIDTSGRVIGVNVAVAEGSQNIGFALPADLVAQAVQSVEQAGKIVRPYIGVRYVLLDEDVAKQFHLSVTHGALVVGSSADNAPAVLPGSPAAKAGLAENDVILAINGTEISALHSLSSFIRDKHVGDRITLTILHKGAQRSVTITLAAAPEDLGS